MSLKTSKIGKKKCVFTKKSITKIHPTPRNQFLFLNSNFDHKHIPLNQNKKYI